MKTTPFLQALGAALLAAISTFAAAQAYPSRTVTLTVPFAAGGPTDTIARIMAERMTRALGQTVVVENITGAGGTIAGNKIAHATPDGYSITIGHVGTHVIAGAVQKIPYDAFNDFEPIAMIASNPQIIVTHPSNPSKDLKELIAWTKSQGKPIASGTGGPGTPSHIMAVYYSNTTGAPMEPIHYKGSGPAIQDLIAGHIQMGFEQAANAIPHIKAGKIKAYAVTSKTRLAAAPEIPTVDEAGLPNFYMSIWHAFWAPKGTPKAVIERLNGAIVESLADPAVQKRLGDLGQEIPPRDQQTPEALRLWHKAEIDKWVPLIKAAKISAE